MGYNAISYSVGCGFEYRCGWHALMREKWARFQSLYILSLTKCMKRNQHLKAILAVTNTSDLYCRHKSRALALRTVGSGSSKARPVARGLQTGAIAPPHPLDKRSARSAMNLFRSMFILLTIDIIVTTASCQVIDNRVKLLTCAR